VPGQFDREIGKAPSAVFGHPEDLKVTPG